MAKTARTYRLSDAALEAVAQRDRAKYPAANDFVEARILEAEKEKKEDEVLQKISGIEKNLERVLGFLAGKKEEGTIHREPPLPDGFYEEKL